MLSFNYLYQLGQLVIIGFRKIAFLVCGRSRSSVKQDAAPINVLFEGCHAVGRYTDENWKMNVKRFFSKKLFLKIIKVSIAEVQFWTPSQGRFGILKVLNNTYMVQRIDWLKIVVNY